MSLPSENSTAAWRRFAGVVGVVSSTVPTISSKESYSGVPPPSSVGQRIERREQAVPVVDEVRRTRLTHGK